ncbi:RING-H2 finger protein ATL47-like [Argentina anserina]|uniref:RING-H2 finger protein ATL47-like n=1 Tax=Argentina anserina TaxID=57926 RepID=UPI0021764CB2|nr:RING-H2 finger protein ATL47-like [Potentilla anserina]
MSPVIFVVVVVLAVIFFIGGLVHLVLRLFIMSSSSPIFQSISRHPAESSSSRNLRRQLQHLFRLHDSGLDQAVIDSLPVFCCKDIVGSDEQFDCAICLCEFSEPDKLRLLPHCGHAFHMDCIDTWLLSNSTCPLCRGPLLGSGLVLENPVLNFDDCGAMSTRFSGDGDNGGLSGRRCSASEEAGGEKRVFSVRLGKFRSSTNEGMEETSIDTKLHIDDKHLKVSGNLEGKKISGCRKGESFSVSKIWLWSKENKFPDSLTTHTGMPSFIVTSPVNGRT